MSRFAVMRRFSSAPLFTRLFIFLRLASCPFEEIVYHIPKKGSLLDIGTGFGLLPLLLSARKNTPIVGIDPDKKRIRIAQKAVKNMRNVTFIVGSLNKMMRIHKYDVASLIDVMYLLPWEEKEKLLRTIHSRLEPRGLLVIKINNRSFSLAYFLTWLQEMLSVRIFKKTTTHFRGLHFENKNDVRILLRQTDFQVIKTVRLKTPFLFFHPHWLILARRLQKVLN